MRTDFRNAVGTEKEKFWLLPRIKYVPFFAHWVFLKGLHDSKKKKNREISDLPQGTLGDPGISARLVIRHRPEGGCHGSIPNIHLISYIELPSLDPCGRLERWA